MEEDLKEILSTIQRVINLSRSEDVSKEWREELINHNKELNKLYNGLSNN